MIRQYVGARYVPKFANPVAWANGTSYEAMTIVTYNNSSYTSKIPVPATVGNPADNPDYWALTGNYNAQVEEYRQETETVSNNLTTEITNRKNADTTLQGQITTLHGQITTVSNNLTTEITNRKNADTTLQGQITTVSNNLTTEITDRGTADATLQDNINSEAATRATADSNLQSQINQIIAPSGEAPSAAEVQNARIGADGVTYDTLGAAIRTQVNDLNEDLGSLENNLSVHKNIANPSKVVKGKTYITPNLIQQHDDWYILEIPVKPNTQYTMWGLAGYCWFSNNNGDTYSSIDEKGGLFTTPPTCTRLLLSNQTGKFYVVNGNFTNDKNYGKDIPYGVMSSYVDKLENIIYSEILLSDTTFTDGKFIAYANGIEVNKDDYCYSDYVRCHEKTLYYTNNKDSYQICFYDKEFNYIGGVIDKYVFESPKNCFYVRISIPIALKNDIYINEFHPLTINVGNNEEFTKIKDAVEFAVRYPNTTVRIKQGTYDLIEEFGTETLENMADGRGIELSNGVHIICNAGTLIKCNYTGSNSYVKTNFSAFNSLTEYSVGTSNLSFGITIENMSLECSNIRYAIHDEHSGSDIPYKNVYKGCNLKLDNTNNDAWDASQCIGGGLGKHADIEVRDCTFVSIGRGNDDGKIPAVSWHSDTEDADSKSRIIVTNCYFKGDNNTFYGGCLRQSQEKSEFIISNNNMGADPYLLGNPPYDDIELVAFNNFIRSK